MKASHSFLCLSLLVLACVPTDLRAETTSFRRGDVNQDGQRDLTDAIVILRHLLLGDPEVLACDDAADVDDSGAKDLTDAIRLLTFIFLGGVEVPPPFDACGVDATADGLGCGSFDPCGPPPLSVLTSIVLQPDVLAVPVGEIGSLTFTAFDQNGAIMAGETVRLVSSSQRLEVSPAGDVSGEIVGFYSVVATGGQVTSEAVRVLVTDPREREVGDLGGSVVLPPGPGGVAGALRVSSPSESVNVSTDGSFVVERLKYRNQLLTVTDELTGSVVWLGVAPGVTDDGDPEPVVLGPGSTAEALLYLTPAITHPDPDNFADFRAVSREHPGLFELTNLIEQFGSEWTSQSAVIAHMVDTVVDDIVGSVIDRILEAEQGGGGASGISSSEGFEPTPHPGYTGGITVTPEKTVGRRADIKIRNTFVRQVDIYLERVGREGSREPGALGPFQMGSSTGIIPSPWQLLFGEFPLPEDELTIPDVNFDPDQGGSRQWRIFAYGVGVQGRDSHAIVKDDRDTDRFLEVLLRSFLLDVAANVASFFVSAPFEALEETFRPLSNVLRAELLASTAYDVLTDNLAEGGALDDHIVAVFDLLTDLFVDFLESDEFHDELVRLSAKLGGSATIEIVEKATIVLEFLSFLSALSELTGFALAIAYSSYVEIIRIDDGPAELVPPAGSLKKGYVSRLFHINNSTGIGTRPIAKVARKREPPTPRSTGNWPRSLVPYVSRSRTAS